MAERNDRLLATVRKNAREEIRITREFKGFDVVGVCVWFQDRDTGEMRPGKDGLAFRAELVDEIIEALGREGWGAMTARGKKIAPHVEASESAIYSWRELAGTVIVERKGQVTALDAAGKRLGTFRTEREAMAAILTAARAARAKR